MSAPDGAVIDEAQIASLVEAFYTKVRKDAVLGPVFNGAIDDWPAHLEKLKAFWSSVVLTSGRYKGNPMAAHAKHRDMIDTAMFVRWLELWRETAADLLPLDVAAVFAAKAERIAESLQLGLFFRLDDHLRVAGRAASGRE